MNNEMIAFTYIASVPFLSATKASLLNHNSPSLRIGCIHWNSYKKHCKRLYACDMKTILLSKTETALGQIHSIRIYRLKYCIHLAPHFLDIFDSTQREMQSERPRINDWILKSLNFPKWPLLRFKYELLLPKFQTRRSFNFFLGMRCNNLSSREIAARSLKST